jgi:lipocalin
MCLHVRVYCDMTMSCGGVTGGWMRVAELDMSLTNSSSQYPGGLRQRNDSDIHTYVRGWMRQMNVSP